MMGCSEGDTECEDSEKPVHKVKITKSFYMGKYEVTQGAVMGNNPSYFVGANCDMPTGCDNHPVEQVSWNDVKSFLVKLNAQEGRTGARMYRLLAEAEWEYAARNAVKLRKIGCCTICRWYEKKLFTVKDF
ncbi:MAG: formylglycine-generating enzyme family protein [Flavobacterium sp.]|nr:formylglycine-generating enzyme family protein [Flavobacterium sp.]